MLVDAWFAIAATLFERAAVLETRCDPGRVEIVVPELGLDASRRDAPADLVRRRTQREFGFTGSIRWS